MDRPTSGRLRWVSALLGVVIVVVVVGVGVATATGRRVLPYQADREILRGTPFVLRTQPGVPGGDEDAVRAGLIATDVLLDDEFGAEIDRTVDVRLTWSQGCRLLTGPTSGASAWYEDGMMCLNANHPAWRRGVDRHAWHPAYLAAREHVRAWTTEFGCGAADAGEWVWFANGMADHLAFVALADAGIVRGADPADLPTTTQYRTVCDDVAAGVPWGDAVAAQVETPSERLRGAFDDLVEQRTG